MHRRCRLIPLVGEIRSPRSRRRTRFLHRCRLLASGQTHVTAARPGPLRRVVLKLVPSLREIADVGESGTPMGGRFTTCSIEEIAMAKEQIEAASEVTDFVEWQLDRLREAMGFTRMVNGYGVYVERREIRQSLEIMRHEIERAINELDATVWPTEKDYEEV